MSKPETIEIDDLGYVEAMRQRLGLDEKDTRKDDKIVAMTPMQRVRLIAGWYHGDESWADTWSGYFESQGLYLTTDAEANGVIHD